MEKCDICGRRKNDCTTLPRPCLFGWLWRKLGFDDEYEITVCPDCYDKIMKSDNK